LALLISPVDFRSRRSLSAGGPGASSALCTCGVSLGPLFPQESRAFCFNQITKKSTMIFNKAFLKSISAQLTSDDYD
jgi:hypothetical protein